VADPTAAIVQRLRAHGFQPYYETTAISLLTHPELPGLEVRIGTTMVTFERDGREVYRAPLARFDPGGRAGARRVARGDNRRAGGGVE